MEIEFDDYFLRVVGSVIKMVSTVMEPSNVSFVFHSSLPIGRGMF